MPKKYCVKIYTDKTSVLQKPKRKTIPFYLKQNNVKHLKTLLLKRKKVLKNYKKKA